MRFTSLLHKNCTPGPTITRAQMLPGQFPRNATSAKLQPQLEKHIAPDVTMIYTDEHLTYLFGLRDKFPGRHRTINHSRSYAIGHTHTNTIENAFSLFKRGLIGSYHHV